DQDQKKISTSDLKLKDSSRKSPSVTEVMSHEKTKELAKSTEDCSDEVVKGVEGQRVNDTIEEVSVNDQPEHEEAKKTSEDSVKKPSEIKEGVPENSKASLSGRPLSSAHFKKKAKAVPSAPPVSSQYLGTLKVLEDKHVQKKRTEFDRADSVRAAVFQNWWEKKRVILQESKRLEKKKAENLRNNTEKKEAVKREEAIASFEAWKKKKGREAKKLSEKKKLEELKKKKKAAEENEEKTEAAQKVMLCSPTGEQLSTENELCSFSQNEKKREYIKQKKVEEILERRKQEIQQAKMEEKNKKAMEEYERWLERKERREQLEKKQKKLQAACRDEVPSPWSPPGRVTYSRNY
ncbi:MAP9 protein, partial [Galbula dea]|nr:MAP9 protein [Galbula dea]